MTKLASCLLGSVFLIFYGCTSYRFQGNVAQAFGNMPMTEKKYRIEKIINKVNNGIYSSGQDAFSVPDPWSIPAVSKKLEETELCSDVMNANPSIFSRSSDSIPLEVEIRSRMESKDGRWSIIFPYILTLGIFPAWMGTASQCELTVTSLMDRNIRTSCIIDFRSDMKLTVFSPIGLVSYDTISGAASCQTGSGLMTAPHVDSGSLWHLRTVYAETLAVAIGRCVNELERQKPTTVHASFKERVNEPRPSVDANSLKEKIQRLKDLKASGVLTDSEFDAKRKALVDQL